MEMSLIVIDAHYKWMEVEIISSTTPQATIEYLRVTFVRFEAVVTDKGTCFNSRVYQV